MKAAYLVISVAAPLASAAVAPLATQEINPVLYEAETVSKTTIYSPNTDTATPPNSMPAAPVTTQFHPVIIEECFDIDIPSPQRTESGSARTPDGSQFYQVTTDEYYEESVEWEYNQEMTSDSARTPDDNQFYQTTFDEYYEKMKEWEYNQRMTSDSAMTPDGNQVYQTTFDEYYEKMKEWEYNQGMTSDSARTPDGNQVYQTTTDEYYEEWVEWDSPQGTTSGSVRIPVGQNSSVPTNAGVSVVIQSYSVITLETGTPIQHNTSNPSPLWGQPSYSTSLRNQSVGAPTKISYATPSYTPATSASGLSPPFVSLSSSTPIATTPILTPPVETQHPAPATSQFVTSVVHTHVYKTTAQSGSTWVVTHTVPLYTTICPVTETQTPEEIIPAPSSFVPMQTSQSNQPTSTPIQFIPAPSSPVQSAPSSWYAPNTPAPVPNIQTSGPVIHSDGTSTGANVVTKTFSVWTTICSEVECNTPPVSPPASNVSIVSPTGLVTGTKGVSTDASFVNSKTVAHTPGASQGTAQPLPNMITSIIYSTATRTITVGGSTQIVTSSVPAFTTTYPATETGNHPGATGIGSTTVTPTGSSSSGDNGFTGDSSPKPTAPLSNGATSTYGVVGFWTAVLAVAAYMV